MSARTCCYCAALAAAMLLPSRAFSDEPSEQNRYLLEQVRVAMQADAAFRRSLERVVEPRLTELILARNDLIDQLRAENRQLWKRIQSLEPSTTSPQPLTLGSLIIENRCPYFVKLKISGELRDFAPGESSWPIWTQKTGGYALVELVGYESPKQWRVSPPNYQTRMIVAPR